MTIGSVNTKQCYMKQFFFSGQQSYIHPTENANFGFPYNTIFIDPSFNRYTLLQLIILYIRFVILKLKRVHYQIQKIKGFVDLKNEIRFMNSKTALEHYHLGINELYFILGLIKPYFLSDSQNLCPNNKPSE